MVDVVLRNLRLADRRRSFYDVEACDKNKGFY
jgi:hypothetical protein